MNIKQKIWLLPALAILTSGFGITATYLFSNSALRTMDEIKDVDYPALNDFNALVTTANAIKENFQYAAAAADRSALSAAAKKADSFKANLAHLATLPAHAEHARAIGRLFDTYLHAANDAVEMMLGTAPGELGPAVKSMQSSQAALLGTLTAAKRNNTERFDSAIVASQHRIQQGVFASIGAAVFIVVGLSAISCFVIASVTSTLCKITERARNDGGDQIDLTAVIDVSNNDELGQIARWINGFVAELRHLVADVYATSRDVESSSKDMAKANLVLSEEANIQTEEATQIAQGVEELTSTIAMVAQSTVIAAESARGAADLAGRGGGVIGETVKDIHEIANTVTAATEQVALLGNSSKQIGKVIEVIRDVAEQTNLLALNAAIEAARAGDQGRGFAVVADEVRELAKRTAHATVEIKQIIDAIQSGIDEAIRGIAAGKTVTAQGREKATAAQAAIEEIIISINNVDKMIQDIASATEQQSATARDISRQAHRIVDIAKNAMDESTRTVQRSNALNTAAETLGGRLRRFKI